MHIQKNLGRNKKARRAIKNRDPKQMTKKNKRFKRKGKKISRKWSNHKLKLIQTAQS